MNVWCSSHRICPCISKKQIFSVTELDFVFYNKIAKDISKNLKNQLTLKKRFCTSFLSVLLLLIKQKLIVYILLIKTYIQETELNF